MEHVAEESSLRSDNVETLNRRLEQLKIKRQNDMDSFIRALDEDLPDLPAQLQHLAPRTTKPESRKDLDISSIHTLTGYAHKPLTEFYRHFDNKTASLEVFTSVYLRTIYHSNEEYFKSEILVQEYMGLFESELEPRLVDEYMFSVSVFRVILARAPESSREEILNLRIVVKMFFKYTTTYRKDVIITVDRFFGDFGLSKILEENYSKWKNFFQKLKTTAEASNAVSSIFGILDSWSQGILSVEEILIGALVNHITLDYFIKFDTYEKSQKEFLASFLRIKEVDDQLKYDLKYLKMLIDLLKVLLPYLFKLLKCFSRKEKEKDNYVMFQSQLLRTQAMFMVLYNLNGTWYRWFDHFHAPLLVDNDDFLCHEIVKEFDDDVSSTANKVINKKFLPLYVDMAERCPFVLPRRVRVEIFKETMKQVWNSRVVLVRCHTISRDKALKDYENLMGVPRLLEIPEKWQLNFRNEMGNGLGPTREAYTLISRELQKSRLDIWYDERSFPGEKSKSEFAYSSSGLYPKPMESKELLLFAFLMVRALLDDAFLDVHLNLEFYRMLTLTNLTPMEFRFHQVHRILPATSCLIEQLLFVKRKKSIILNDASLTKKEKYFLIDKLDFKEGCSFGDLSINFTIPGTDIELMDGGKDVLITPFNMDRYLVRLGEKVIHKDIYLSFEFALESFGVHLNLSMFLPEELESLFCGQHLEPWNVDELKTSFKFENGFTSESKAVQYFLEVLASFDTDGQRLFLQFISGRTRLPCGGFSNLKPVLTVSRDNSPDGDHDRRLPSVSTCYNTINLPDYSSMEIAKERLMYAMSECKSFQIT